MGNPVFGLYCVVANKIPKNGTWIKTDEKQHASGYFSLQASVVRHLSAKMATTGVQGPYTCGLEASPHAGPFVPFAPVGLRVPTIMAEHANNEASHRRESCSSTGSLDWGSECNTPRSMDSHFCFAAMDSPRTQSRESHSALLPPGPSLQVFDCSERIDNVPLCVPLIRRCRYPLAPWFTSLLYPAVNERRARRRNKPVGPSIRWHQTQLAPARIVPPPFPPTGPASPGREDPLICPMGGPTLDSSSPESVGTPLHS